MDEPVHQIEQVGTGLALCELALDKNSLFSLFQDCAKGGLEIAKLWPKLVLEGCGEIFWPFEVLDESLGRGLACVEIFWVHGFVLPE